jgi:hypothetical protein
LVQLIKHSLRFTLTGWREKQPNKSLFINWTA